MVRAGQPQAADASEETWAVHRASQSASSLSKNQLNALLLAAFFSSFVLNFRMDGPSSSGGSKHHHVEPAAASAIYFERLVIIVVLGLMIGWCTLLVFKIRECLVWPEEVRFFRDGMVVVELGCGYRALDSREGLTLYRRRPGICNGLGVWCNAVTDKTRDEIFVLVPSSGPVYWRGFAFQPLDVASFLSDCRHAGIFIADEHEDNVAMVSSNGDRLEEGLIDGMSSSSEMAMNDGTSGAYMPPPVPLGIARTVSEDSTSSSDGLNRYSESEEDETLPEEDDVTASKDLEQEIKNNNIIEV